MVDYRIEELATLPSLHASRNFVVKELLDAVDKLAYDKRIVFYFYAYQLANNKASAILHYLKKYKGNKNYEVKVAVRRENDLTTLNIFKVLKENK